MTHIRKTDHLGLRRALLILALLGITLFGAAFVISWLNPLLVERGAREVVRIEVERRVGEKLDSLSSPRVTTLAQKALGKTDAELEHARRQLVDGVSQKVAQVVADMLNADCECRKRLVERAVTGQQERITSLAQARDRLLGQIELAYASVTANLMREFRIFTASNAAAFALLALVTYYRRAAALQLALPAVVLVGAVGITAGLYLFNQNWLHTVLYSQYVGLAYVAYLGAAAALLADVLFNRARVSTRLVNGGLHALGSAVQAVPC